MTKQVLHLIAKPIAIWLPRQCSAVLSVLCAPCTRMIRALCNEIMYTPRAARGLSLPGSHFRQPSALFQSQLQVHLQRVGQSCRLQHRPWPRHQRSHCNVKPAANSCVQPSCGLMNDRTLSLHLHAINPVKGSSAFQSGLSIATVRRGGVVVELFILSPWEVFQSSRAKFT